MKNSSAQSGGHIGEGGMSNAFSSFFPRWAAASPTKTMQRAVEKRRSRTTNESSLHLFFFLLPAVPKICVEWPQGEARGLPMTDVCK